MAAKKSSKKVEAAAVPVDGSSTAKKAKAPARKAKAPTSSAPELLAPASPVPPTFDEIRERAYALHLAGGVSSMDNWLRAERELRSERGIGA